MTTQNLTFAQRPPAPLALDEVALFLDLDGTLAPIMARPQDVGPETRRTQILDRLNRTLGGRLAIVTGRTFEDVDRILDGRVRCVAAVHGLALRDQGGAIVKAAPHPALVEAADTLRTVANAHPGMIVEDKGLSVTLHYRLAPAGASRALETAARLAAETGLTLQPGHMVVELRTPGHDKGDSVRAFMGRPPFAGKTPVFVGDDVTDEVGFAAAGELGGFGVLVGPPRATAARWRMTDVGAVLDWLEAAR
jgi:trehalose 6-phosphate phosphatase